MLAGAALQCSDSLKYLGMTYHQTLNMTASSENAAIPILAAAFRIHGFVQDTALCDSPFASLWLAKAYVLHSSSFCRYIPVWYHTYMYAGICHTYMYGCQVWSSGFLRKGDIFRPTLQTLHLNFLKGTLGVKRSAPNWAV